MPLVELIAPKGSLDSDRGREVTSRLLTEVMAVEGADPGNEIARSISWLVVTEPDAWYVGGEPVGDDAPPRFVARVSVPAGSLDDAKRADLIERVTKLLASIDDDPERAFREPSAWVHIHEVPDGNWGAFGRVVRLSDIAGFVMAGEKQPTG